MSSQDNLASKFRSSFLLALTSAALIVFTISCSDIAEDGITKSEVEQTQSQITMTPNEDAPLYIINGEEWDKDELATEKVSRLKPRYIEYIEVLKGEEARKEYGEKGQNGVVKIKVLNPDKAFADLRGKAPVPPSTPTKSDDGDYYITAREMPKLKDGLAGLQREISYPEEARKAGIKGRVIVQFIVNKEGKVENPQIVKGIGGGCDEEALRVVRKAEFEPGLQNGEPVRVQYAIPITYQLPSDTSE